MFVVNEDKRMRSKQGRVLPCTTAVQKELLRRLTTIAYIYIQITLKSIGKLLVQRRGCYGLPDVVWTSLSLIVPKSRRRVLWKVAQHTKNVVGDLDIGVPKLSARRG